MKLTTFLLFTFGISLTGFLCVATVPGAQTPESPLGLPFWLIMIWGPSLSAIVLSARHGEFGQLLRRSVRIASIPPEAWGLVVGPLILFGLLMPFAPDERITTGAGIIVASILFNLVLGPLGEELGWRGILQQRLNQRIGWFGASLIVGIVWLLWHLPLWLIDSPHSQIHLPLFAAHCMLYAILIGAIHTLSGGSILPAILTHLTINLAANWAVFSGYQEPDAWFETSLWHFAALAAVATAIVQVKLNTTRRVRAFL